MATTASDARIARWSAGDEVLLVLLERQTPTDCGAPNAYAKLGAQGGGAAAVMTMAQPAHDRLDEVRLDWAELGWAGSSCHGRGA